MFRIKLFAVGFLFLILTQITGCEYNYFEPVTLSDQDTVSFAKDVLPILHNHCQGSGCHVSGGVTPDLSDDYAYSSLTDGGYVDTLNPEQSTIYLRLTASIKYMPPSGKLPELSIQRILQWIKQGARDN